MDGGDLYEQPKILGHGPLEYQDDGRPHSVPSLRQKLFQESTLCRIMCGLGIIIKLNDNNVRLSLTDSPSLKGLIANFALSTVYRKYEEWTQHMEGRFVDLIDRAGIKDFVSLLNPFCIMVDDEGVIYANSLDPGPLKYQGNKALYEGGAPTHW